MRAALVGLAAWPAVGLAAWLAVGCGGALTLSRVVRHAPPWTLRDVPVVYVVADARAELAPTVTRFVERLSQQGPRVVRASAAELATARAAGAMPEGALVVSVAISDALRDRVTWLDRTSPFPVDPHAPVPPSHVAVDSVLDPAVVVVVSDAVTGRDLSRAVLQCGDECGGDLATREETLDALGARVVALVSPFEARSEVVFVGAGVPGAAAAEDAIARGHAHDGRLALEALAGNAAALAPPVRAALLHDLGQARRVDDADPADALSRLAAAEEALRRAYRLAPKDATREAIRGVVAERRALAERRAADDAFALNRELAAATAPPPPPAYH